MKKNALITLLAGTMLFTAGSSTIMPAPTNVAYAKTVKKAHKAVKHARYQAIRRTPVYHVKFNKDGSKVLSITKPSKKKDLVYIGKGHKYIAYWVTTYKKNQYYYLGGTYAVRAQDFKHINKVTVPDLNVLTQQVAAAKLRAKTKKAKAWQKKIDAAQPVLTTATVTTNTVYWVLNANSGFEKASSTLPINTKLSIMFISNDLLSNGARQVPAYFAKTYDGKIVIIPASTAKLDNNQHIYTQAEYTAKIKQVNKLVSQAQKALN